MGLKLRRGETQTQGEMISGGEDRTKDGEGTAEEERDSGKVQGQGRSRVSKETEQLECSEAYRGDFEGS